MNNATQKFNKLDEINDTLLSCIHLEKTKEVEIVVDLWLADFISKNYNIEHVHSFNSENHLYSVKIAGHAIKVFVDYNLGKFQMKRKNGDGLIYPYPENETVRQ